MEWHIKIEITLIKTFTILECRLIGDLRIINNMKAYVETLMEQVDASVNETTNNIIMMGKPRSRFPNHQSSKVFMMYK